MSMENPAPLVTLALTTYNGARTVERALESLADQTWPNIEILIGDDASQDETVALCKAFAERHDNVRLIAHEQNLGWFGCRNVQFLATEARGDYIAWVCQDDYWDPDFVKNQVEAIESVPQGVAAMCAHGLFPHGSDTSILEVLETHPSYWPQNNSRFRNFKHTMRRTRQKATGRLLSKSFVIHCVVRAEAFREAILAAVGPSECERQFAAFLSILGTCIYVDKIDCYKQTTIDNAETMTERDACDSKAHLAKNKAIADQRVPLHHYVAGFIVAVWRSRLMSLTQKVTGTAFILSYFFERLPGRTLRKIVFLAKSRRRRHAADPA